MWNFYLANTHTYTHTHTHTNDIASPLISRKNFLFQRQLFLLQVSRLWSKAKKSSNLNLRQLNVSTFGLFEFATFPVFVRLKLMLMVLFVGDHILFLSHTFDFYNSFIDFLKFAVQHFWKDEKQIKKNVKTHSMLFQCYFLGSKVRKMKNTFDHLFFAPTGQLQPTSEANPPLQQQVDSTSRSAVQTGCTGLISSRQLPARRGKENVCKRQTSTTTELPNFSNLSLLCVFFWRPVNLFPLFLKSAMSDVCEGENGSLLAIWGGFHDTRTCFVRFFL